MSPVVISLLLMACYVVFQSSDTRRPGTRRGANPGRRLYNALPADSPSTAGDHLGYPRFVDGRHRIPLLGSIAPGMRGRKRDKSAFGNVGSFRQQFRDATVVARSNRKGCPSSVERHVRIPEHQEHVITDRSRSTIRHNRSALHHADLTANPPASESVTPLPCLSAHSVVEQLSPTDAIRRLTRQWKTPPQIPPEQSDPPRSGRCSTQ